MSSPAINSIAVALCVPVSWLLVGLAGTLSTHIGILAHPGRRQSHSVITPSGGGLGMVLAILVTWQSVYLIGEQSPDPWLYAFGPGLVILTLTGWLDDRYALAPWLRLLIQLAVSLWLLASLPIAQWMAGGTWAASTHWLIVTLAIGTLVWITNMYNFMDGSDGMAAFQGTFFGVVIGWLLLDSGAHSLALVGFLMAAACAGFLPWNFPRAHMFMGDAGSIPLGYLAGGLVLIGGLSGRVPFSAGILLLGVFMVDSGLTLMGRVFRGEQWYTAHNQHLYQKLITRGWSHSQVLFLYQSINLFLVLPVLVMERVWPGRSWLLTGMTIALLICAWFWANLKIGVKT